MSRPTQKCKSRVQKHIRKHFPKLATVKPRITSRKYGGQTRHHFTFRKALVSSDGKKFKQVIRLTTDEEGKVLKTTTSR